MPTVVKTGDTTNTYNTTNIYSKDEVDKAIDAKISNIIADAPEEYNTLKELVNLIDTKFSDLQNQINVLKQNMASGTNTNTSDDTSTSDTTAAKTKTYLPYLTFSSTASLTIKTAKGSKQWGGTVEYSIDLSTWTEWDGTAITASEGTIYMRGTGNTLLTGASSDYQWKFTTDGQLSCIGNIENLLDYPTVAKGGHPTMTSYCFAYMFNGCTKLIQCPELPAIELSDSCYNNMFDSCTSLTQAPELPATTLASNCYYAMFKNCKVLTAIHLASSVQGNSYITYFPGDSCTATVYYDL